MKNIIVSLIIICLFFAVWTATAFTDPESNDITLKVRGLVCAHCARALEETLKKNPAIESMRLDLGEKAVFISIKEGHTLDNQILMKIILDAGYTVASIDRDSSQKSRFNKH